MDDESLSVDAPCIVSSDDSSSELQPVSDIGNCTSALCPTSNFDSTFVAFDSSPLLSAPFKRNSTILETLDLDDLTAIDLTSSTKRVKTPRQKKSKAGSKRTYSVRTTDRRLSGSVSFVSNSASNLNSVDFADSSTNRPPNIRYYKKIQSRLRVQRFRFRRQLVRIKQKNENANKKVSHMYTVHDRKSYGVRKVEFISRVGFCPSASAARAPLANIIRFITDQQLSRTTVDEYRTRYSTNGS